MLHAVIMAGGSGTRFWPESRDHRPKQLLNLFGDATMIQATAARLAGLIPAERTIVMTNRRQAAAIASQLPALPPAAILAEPCKRDTAPCIALAAAHLLHSDPDAVMAVMPSDAVIQPVDKFQAAIRLAAQFVADDADRFVTLGIPPTYAAESFGYIERGATLPAPSSAAGENVAQAYAVTRFREKPKADAAREYVASGNFYWNAGIFIWRAATLMAQLEQLQPEMFARIRTIAAALGTPNYEAVLEREFAAIRGISIDFAVMEHAKNVVVIAAPFEWDDVGSWQALPRLAGSDEAGNTVVGRHLGIRTTGTLVRTTPEHLVVTVGLQDCIVVHTADATLVARKADEESVREVAKQLATRGWNEFL
jgi:mannose-1-phosphate guanylyltransferase